MKVLWLSPWLRGLARVQIDALAAHGVETLLVTSDQHPETRGTPRHDEIVLRPSPRRAGTWPQFTHAWRRARAFEPDVVVAELVRDPRWSAFARLAPVVHAVHDDEPHDASERPPVWSRGVTSSWQRAAVATVVFSEYVADVMAVRGVQAAVVPLTSDLPDAAVPPFVPAPDRRDFVLVGRLMPYKNGPVAFAAWERHVAGAGYRGDRLVLIGGGEVGALPSGVVHRNGAYRYSDVVPTLAAAKASLVHYRHASQSGTQVLAMQLGVAPIASPRGALFTTQPAGAPVVDVDDVAGLAAAFDDLADPGVAATVGAAAQERYRAEHAVDHAAAAWLEVLRAATRAAPTRSP